MPTRNGAAAANILVKDDGEVFTLGSFSAFCTQMEEPGCEGANWRPGFDMRTESRSQECKVDEWVGDAAPLLDKPGEEGRKGWQFSRRVGPPPDAPNPNEEGERDSIIQPF